MSGRKPAHAPRPASSARGLCAGSLVRPWMTCTKAAWSGSPGVSTSTSVLSRKVGSPVNSFAVCAHHVALLGPVAVAPRGVLGLEPGDADGLAVGGHAAGRAEPAGRAGRQLRDPPVERLPGLGSIGDLTLDDLHEHRRPLSPSYLPDDSRPYDGAAHPSTADMVKYPHSEGASRHADRRAARGGPGPGPRARPAGERRHDPQPRARRPHAVAGPPALGAARPRAEHPERAGRGPRGEPAQRHRAGRRPGRHRLRHPRAAPDRPPGHPGVVHRPRRPDGGRASSGPARVRRGAVRRDAGPALRRPGAGLWPTCSTGSGPLSPRRRHSRERPPCPSPVGPSLFEIALYRSLFRWVTRRPDVPAGGVAFSYVGAVALLLWVVHQRVRGRAGGGAPAAAVGDDPAGGGRHRHLGAALDARPRRELHRAPARRHGRPGCGSGRGTGSTSPCRGTAVATVGVRERSRDTSKALQVDRSEQAVGAQRRDGQPDRRRRHGFERPLLVPVRGGEESVTEIRLYADEPRALVAAAREHLAPAAQPKRSST